MIYDDPINYIDEKKEEDGLIGVDMGGMRSGDRGQGSETWL